MSYTDWKEKISQPPYCITVKRCPDEKYSELYMLSYDQIKSTLRNPVVRACRGTVVVVKDNKDPYIACAPFFKFFNYGEDVDIVDWQTASVQEKVDGSLIKCFYFKDKWFWVTNNSWNYRAFLPISPLQGEKGAFLCKNFTLADLAGKEQIRGGGVK